MGTNYYLMIDEDDKIDVSHIGKMTSDGFSIRAYEGIQSYDDWVKILEKTEHCFDESGREIDSKDILEMIKNPKEIVEEYFC